MLLPRPRRLAARTSDSHSEDHRFKSGRGHFMKRKYVCHIVGVGFIATLIVFASRCRPLTVSELTLIAKSRFNAPCYLESFSLELPELSEGYASPIFRNSYTYGTSASNVSPSPSPAFENSEG